jgi:hypothetical protein
VKPQSPYEKRLQITTYEYSPYSNKVFEAQVRGMHRRNGQGETEASNAFLQARAVMKP